jgi:hypothetical protein
MAWQAGKLAFHGFFQLLIPAIVDWLIAVPLRQSAIARAWLSERQV